MILQYKIAIFDLYVDKNCHNKQFVTISGVTISRKHCIISPPIL